MSPAEAGAPAAPAVDYVLAVPESWHRIELSPENRARDIERLVAAQFRGQDNVPHLKAAARAGLEEEAGQGWLLGGIELYISQTVIGGVPLAASLLVSGTAPAEGGRDVSPDDLAESYDLDGAEASVVDLPAGRSVRVRSVREMPQAGESRPPASTGVDFHIPVPGIGGHLLLSFSTPMPAPLTDAMVELFDAIAETVRWKGR